MPADWRLECPHQFHSDCTVPPPLRRARAPETLRLSSPARERRTALQGWDEVTDRPSTSELEAFESYIDIGENGLGGIGLTPLFEPRRLGGDAAAAALLGPSAETGEAWDLRS